MKCETEELGQEVVVIRAKVIDVETWTHPINRPDVPIHTNLMFDNLPDDFEPVVVRTSPSPPR